MQLEQDEQRFTAVEQLLTELSRAAPTAKEVAAEKVREQAIAAAAAKNQPAKPAPAKPVPGKPNRFRR